jgi:hypothetical protein
MALLQAGTGMGRLNDEPGAALAAPSAQNLPAAGGFHSGAESVRAFPANHGGLIRAFHLFALPGKKALY